MSTALSAPVPAGTRLKSSMMRATVLVASLAIAVVALTFAPSDSASAQDLNQCNGIDNQGGQGLICSVDVVNYMNVATGVTSSEVTVKVCRLGANTVPTAGDCTVTTTPYNTYTSTVNQCNDSANGGKASLECRVSVINNITGDAKAVAASINQCVGSGGGGGTEPTLNCDPNPSSTTNATITQCNGSVNGDGATKRVTCTVAPNSAFAEGFPVLVDQCNRSANGGQAVATCDVSMETVITAAGTTTPTPIETTPIKNTLYDSKTDGIALADSNETAFLGAGVLMLLAGGLLTAAFATRKVGARR